MKLEEGIKKVFERSEKSLVEFRTLLLSNGEDQVGSAKFHHDWSKLLLNARDKSNIAIQGYRESAKSQYFLRSFPLYCLRFPQVSRTYIVILKNTATLARNVLREIENEYTTNPALKINIKEVKEQSSDVFSVDVFDQYGGIHNVRIEAYGKGGSLRGISNQDRRPHVIIGDDLQDLEDSRSEVVSESDWNWFLSDVNFLGGGKRTKIILIGNNLGEACIIERVFNNADDLGFKTMKVPCMIQDEPTWPERNTIEEIKSEQEDFRKLGKLDVWFREKMCEAIAEESKVFKNEDRRYFGYRTNDELREKNNVFFTIDPASSKNKDSCYRAIVVNGVSEENYWFIHDLPYGRWDAAEFIEVLFEKVRQWNPMKVGIEKGMFKQIIEPFIYKEMQKRNTFFEIVPIEHAKAGSKLERVKMLGPRYKAHTIWHPDEAPWLAELESELDGVTKDGFKSLYVDLIDALAMQEQIVEAPFKSMRGKDLPRQGSLDTVIE